MVRPTRGRFFWMNFILLARLLRTEPQYLDFYFLNNALTIGQNDSPDVSLGFVLVDAPCAPRDSLVQAEVQLAGVIGTGCNVAGVPGLVNSPANNCSWQAVGGSGWRWTLSNAGFAPSPIPGPL
jgi:hypothetical protein